MQEMINEAIEIIGSAKVNHIVKRHNHNLIIDLQQEIVSLSSKSPEELTKMISMSEKLLDYQKELMKL